MPLLGGNYHSSLEGGRLWSSGRYRFFFRTFILIMRRLCLHTLFWAVYWLQDLLLQYSWLNPYLDTMSEGRQIWLASLTATVVLIPKMLVVYYFLYRATPKVGNEKTKWIGSILEMVVVLVSGILLFRWLTIIVVKPVLYNDHSDKSLLEIRSILIAILQIGFVTGIAVMIKFAKLRISEKERDKLLVKDKLETELKFLRNQTKPHFLLNTLNNIYALARKKSDDVPEALLKLSELLQFILYQSTSRFITLAGEVKIIEHYLQLEQMRYTHRLQISFDRKMDSGFYFISPLLLLPFVENAFKHGISETRFESFIRIRLEVEKGLLKFRIENSKDHQRPQPCGNNIGLVNVKRQLELTYHDYILDVEDEETIFSIYLSINLRNHIEL
jgi:two-component system LytT family sensor kinase